MTPDAMLRHGGDVFACGMDQLAPPQGFQGALHRTFGKPGTFCNQAQAGRDRFPSLPLRGAVEMEVNQKGRRLSIMPDQVTHQDIEDVIVDRDALAKNAARIQSELGIWILK